MQNFLAIDTLLRNIIPGHILVAWRSMATGNRLSLTEMIQARDLRERCPKCWEKMRYKKVSGSMVEWSPSPYAWFCPVCPSVMLDGSIMPGEQTWITRMQEREDSMRADERRRVSEYLAAALRDKKTNPTPS